MTASEYGNFVWHGGADTGILLRLEPACVPLRHNSYHNALLQGIVEVMSQTVQAGAGTTQPTMEGIQAASLVTM